MEQTVRNEHTFEIGEGNHEWESDKLQVKIDDMNGIQSGLIRIGTFSSVATHWIPNIISEFQKEYPNIEYELLLGD